MYFRLCRGGVSVVTTSPALRAVPDEEPEGVDELDGGVDADSTADLGPSIADAADTGDPLAVVEAMIRKIAATLSSEKCQPRDMASLSRRMLELLRERDLLRAKLEAEAAESAGSTPAGADSGGEDTAEDDGDAAFDPAAV